MTNTLPQNIDDLKAAVKPTLVSVMPQQRNKLITSMPQRIAEAILGKGHPNKYWVYK